MRRVGRGREGQGRGEGQGEEDRQWQGEEGEPPASWETCLGSGVTGEGTIALMVQSDFLTVTLLL